MKSVKGQQVSIPWTHLQSQFVLFLNKLAAFSYSAFKVGDMNITFLNTSYSRRKLMNCSSLVLFFSKFVTLCT